MAELLGLWNGMVRSPLDFPGTSYIPELKLKKLWPRNINKCRQRKKEKASTKLIVPSQGAWKGQPRETENFHTAISLLWPNTTEKNYSYQQKPSGEYRLSSQSKEARHPFPRRCGCRGRTSKGSGPSAPPSGNKATIPSMVSVETTKWNLPVWYLTIACESIIISK